MNKKMRNTVIIAFVVAIAFILFVKLYLNGNKNIIEISNTSIQDNRTNNENENVKTLNNCTFKHFKPVFENGYDYTQDMVYKDKIYYKLITDYDEYQTYKNRWNEICNMSKEDFDRKFMIITAIENTSMLGLTLSDIFVNKDTLYIDLDEYKEGEEYNKEETCISIVAPNELKASTIEPRDIRKVKETPEYTYGWQNEPTEGRTMIGKNEAVDIAKRYAQSLTRSSSMLGKYLQGYTKVYEVNLTKKKPNNYWLIEEGVPERNFVQANFERDVYEVTLVAEDDEMEIERAIFDVDAYTGQVIGGRQMGD